MAGLEDTLKKIYGLPESTTPTMPRVPMLGNETGAVINEAERLQSSDDVRAGDPGYNKMGSEASVATGQAINELMMQINKEL